MPLLQMELVELEVEPLEVVEFSRPKQNDNLDTLVDCKGEGDSIGVLILKGKLPTNDNPPGLCCSGPAPSGCCCNGAFNCFCSKSACCGCCPDQGYCC